MAIGTPAGERRTHNAAPTLSAGHIGAVSIGAGAACLLPCTKKPKAIALRGSCPLPPSASSGEFLNQVWILTQGRAYVRRPPGSVLGTADVRSDMRTDPAV